MSYQNTDPFAIITVASIILVIVCIAMPFFVLIFFQRKRLYQEEKARMNARFESEVLKTQIEVQEQTMQNIATELHDNIGQLLSLTTLTLNSIDVKEPEKSEKKIADSMGLVNKSIKDLRDLAKLLQGEQIVEAGLGKAIEQELDRLKRVGVHQINVNNDIADLDVFSPNKDLIILRLLQEIINNIIKHSKATSIDVNISLSNGVLNLQVRENGMGFNYQEIKLRKNGLGLNSMHKRVEMLAGKMLVDSRESEGTLITIEIPYP